MTPAAESFITDVERFCHWAEGSAHPLGEARQHLLSLMSAVPQIEEFRHKVHGDQEFPRRELADSKLDYANFSDLPFQYYYTAFDPHDFESEDNEPCVGDLTDDLADIYGDLWQGLQASQAGEKEEALRLWIDSYFSHWGQHASSALWAIDDFYRKN